MGTVTQLPTKLSISDYAKALLELETQRNHLDHQSDLLSQNQARILQKAYGDIMVLSKDQEVIIANRIALDDTILKLLVEARSYAA